jgi:hypothetical protein
MPEHKDITDPNLHEPKGVASATAGQVYVANGSGSGTWGKPTAANTTVLDSSGYFTGNTVEEVLEEIYEKHFYFYDRIPDVSSASFVLVPVPENMSIQMIRFVLGGAITSDDDTLTITRGVDNALLGTQTITQSGSAEGSTFDFTPASNQLINSTTHKYIKIATDGASGSAVPLYFTVIATRG